MSNITFKLTLFKGDIPIAIPNMQIVFLSEPNAKASTKHSKFILQKHGVTHYEIIEHHESFISKGKFQI